MDTKNEQTPLEGVLLDPAGSEAADSKTRIETANPKPSTTASNKLDQHLDDIREACETFADLARSAESNEGYESDYLAGVYLLLYRLIAGFSQSVVPLGPIVYESHQFLKASLKEHIENRVFAEEQLKTLKSIDKRLESIDASTKRMVDGLIEVYKAVKGGKP